MKFKSLLFVCCLGLLSSAFADNRYFHPQANTADAKSTDKKVRSPGFCEIEIRNFSYDDVVVSGYYDDGKPRTPLNVYRNGSPLYLDLYYYGYCHAGMTLYIDTFSGYRVYAGYTPVQSTVDVVPGLANQLKVQIKPK